MKSSARAQPPLRVSNRVALSGRPRVIVNSKNEETLAIQRGGGASKLMVLMKSQSSSFPVADQHVISPKEGVRSWVPPTPPNLVTVREARHASEPPKNENPVRVWTVKVSDIAALVHVWFWKLVNFIQRYSFL